MSAGTTGLAQRYLAAIQGSNDSKIPSDGLNKIAKNKNPRTNPEPIEKCESVLPISNDDHLEEEAMQSRNGSTSPSRLRPFRPSLENTRDAVADTKSIGGVLKNERTRDSSLSSDSQEKKWTKSQWQNYRSKQNVVEREENVNQKVNIQRGRRIDTASPVLTDVSDPVTIVINNRSSPPSLIGALELKNTIAAPQDTNMGNVDDVKTRSTSLKPWQRRKIKASSDQGWIKSSAKRSSIGRSVDALEIKDFKKQSPEMVKVVEDCPSVSAIQDHGENDTVEAPSVPQHQIFSPPAEPSARNPTQPNKEIKSRSAFVSKPQTKVWGTIQLRSVNKRVTKDTPHEVNAQQSQLLISKSSSKKENLIEKDQDDSTCTNTCTLSTNEPVNPISSLNRKDLADKNETDLEFVSVKDRLRSWNANGRNYQYVRSSSSTSPVRQKISPPVSPKLNSASGKKQNAIDLDSNRGNNVKDIDKACKSELTRAHKSSSPQQLGGENSVAAAPKFSISAVDKNSLKDDPKIDYIAARKSLQDRIYTFGGGQTAKPVQSGIRNAKNMKLVGERTTDRIPTEKTKTISIDLNELKLESSPQRPNVGKVADNGRASPSSVYSKTKLRKSEPSGIHAADRNVASPNSVYSKAKLLKPAAKPAPLPLEDQKAGLERPNSNFSDLKFRNLSPKSTEIKTMKRMKASPKQVIRREKLLKPEKKSDVDVLNSINKVEADKMDDKESKLKISKSACNFPEGNIRKEEARISPSSLPDNRFRSHNFKEGIEKVKSDDADRGTDADKGTASAVRSIRAKFESSSSNNSFPVNFRRGGSSKSCDHRIHDEEGRNQKTTTDHAPELKKQDESKSDEVDLKNTFSSPIAPFTTDFGEIADKSGKGIAAANTDEIEKATPTHFQGLRTQLEAKTKQNNPNASIQRVMTSTGQEESMQQNTQDAQPIRGEKINESVPKAISAKECDENNKKIGCVQNSAFDRIRNVSKSPSPMQIIHNKRHDNGNNDYVDNPNQALNSCREDLDQNQVGRFGENHLISAFSSFGAVGHQPIDSREMRKNNDIPWKVTEPNDIPWTDRELLEERERSFHSQRAVNMSYSAEYLDYSYEDDDCDGVTLSPSASDVSSLSIPFGLQSVGESSAVSDSSQTSDEAIESVSASEKQSTTVGPSEASSSQTSEAATPLIQSMNLRFGKCATSSDTTGTMSYGNHFAKLLETLPPPLDVEEKDEDSDESTYKPSKHDAFGPNKQFEEQLNISREPQWKSDLFAVDSVKSNPTVGSAEGTTSKWAAFDNDPSSSESILKSAGNRTVNKGILIAPSPFDSIESKNSTPYPTQQRSMQDMSIGRKSTSVSTSPSLSPSESLQEKDKSANKVATETENLIDIPKPSTLRPAVAYRRFNLQKVRAFQKARSFRQD